MRCKATTGFLMLRRCEQEAMFQCVYCGKELCGEHSTVVYDTAAPQPAPAAVSPDAPAKPPMGGQSVACPTCVRKQQLTTGTGAAAGAFYDPYYSYPYYGSYRPYFLGAHFDDRDRRVFDRKNQPASDVTASDVGESEAWES
jgi:hypothetical protein